MPRRRRIPRLFEGSDAVGTLTTPPPGEGKGPPRPQESPPSSPPTRRRKWWSTPLRILSAVVLVLVLGAGAAAVWETRTSTLQARYIVPLAEELTYEVGEGASTSIVFPGDGPYDRRLGYHTLPDMVASAEARGFRVVEQARVSQSFREMVEDRGIFPIYTPKAQAGFAMVDREGEPLFRNPRPERVFSTFEEVPPILWQTLLFIENRTALDTRFPMRNPAVEWGRLFRSAGELGLRYLGREGNVAGASTLATQIEKYRHAPDGLTESPRDKLLQMASASLRHYRYGPETLEARKRVVVDYLNSVPLAAIRGEGEVNGIGDGMWAWYGVEFPDAVRALSAIPAGRVETIPAPEEVSPGWSLPEGETQEIATLGLHFRQALSLLLSQRRPSYFLASSEGRAALSRLTDRYLGALEGAGVIDDELATAARSAAIEPRTLPPERPPIPFVERKAVNAVRAQLLGVLGVPTLYDLDRLDLTVRTTIDGEAQQAVTNFLVRLHDPAFVREHGMDDFRLLDRGEIGLVVYSFALHERTPRGNVVRIQADNLDAPFNLNESARLELGSTAKLRTLASYLEVLTDVHTQLSEMSPQEMRALPISSRDVLALWVRGQLLAEPDLDLLTLLRRGMDRQYSANPQERFATGGGVQTFSNFDNTYDRQALTVTASFRHSVNLPFVRIMRDVVNHYMYRVPGSTAHVLEERDTPLRQEYLSRFADREGIQFLGQFYPKYQGKSRGEILEALFQGRRLTPQRVAWAYRTVAPDGTEEELEVVLRTYDPDAEYREATIADLFRRANPTGQSLADLGFLASIHPLELWVAGYLLRHPEASRSEVVRESAEARQEVYRWLFRTSRTAAQDQRIRALLEVEAFEEILRGWRRVGYPFANIVPSLGTSIGSSGDRPAALNELVGIILNDGIHLPTYRVEELHFAGGTPYETRMAREGFVGERVLPSAVATVLREAMIDVVEEGTARRTRGAVRTPDGTFLSIGAKTGTGDNRYRVFAPGGRLLESRSVNRTSTLVFFIGDRYYGVVSAYVPGAEADRFRFTSALPSQILRELGPVIEALIREGGDVEEPAPTAPDPTGT